MEENHYGVILNNRNELRLDGVRKVLSFLEEQAEPADR